MAQDWGRYVAIYRAAQGDEFGADYGANVPLDGFKIVDLDFSPTAKMCGAPIETGYMFNDNKVIEPPILNVKGIIKSNDYKSVYEQIKKMYLNRRFEFYRVFSKMGYMDNLCLLEMPHKEDAEKYDAVEMTLKFQQVMMDEQSGKPGSDSDSDTKAIGLVVGG